MKHFSHRCIYCSVNIWPLFKSCLRLNYCDVFILNKLYNAWNNELYRNVNLTFQDCFFSHQLILRTLNVILEWILTWILLKHSIFNVKFSIGPLGSITATEVLWHQYDRINTSKAESGPTAASHSQCSTFHVLLRFTTISHKPTASQTEKKIMESTCCYRVFPQLRWNISNATFDDRLKFNRPERGKRCLDCVTWAACKGPFKSDIQAEIIAAWLHGFGFLWCSYLIVSMEGKLKSHHFWGEIYNVSDAMRWFAVLCVYKITELSLPFFMQTF